MIDFPIYQVPYLGNGMTIALDAVIHVILGHGFAIGAFTMVVYAEWMGFKHKSIHWETFAKDFIRPLIIIITGVGAVTGVGIWFTISALAPRGTGNMLRVFFWPWFIEWAVFTAEVIVILIYYFLWDKWSERKKWAHIKLGCSYTFLAMMSGVLITGILGFMLTPDGWPWDQSFWKAFFNPSFLPQLFVRFGLAFFLGSVFTISFLLFTKRDPEFKKLALKKFGLFGLIALAVWFLAAVWYFSVVPSTFKTHAIFSVLTGKFSQYTTIFWVVNIAALIFLIIFAVMAFTGRIGLSKTLVIPTAILAMLFVTEFERVREFIRGPYLMPGYMYANQILLKETPMLEAKGTVVNSYWYEKLTNKKNLPSQGLYLFGKNCSVCHTIDGLNDIKAKVKGRSRDGVFVIVKNSHKMVPFMPPFSGSRQEQRIVSEFIYRLANDEIQLQAPSRFILNDIKIKKGGKQ